MINGVLESAGQGAVTNREASPDAGGWSVAGVYELKAGKNVIRLEHKNRYPYFEAFTLTPFAGAEAPKSVQQVARQYGVNPGYLDQWVEEMRRAKGAPHSVLLPLFAYEQKKTLRGDALAGWTSAAIERFRGYEPASREDLAARYQQLFDEAGKAWDDSGSEANRRIERRNQESGAQRRQTG